MGDANLPVCLPGLQGLPVQITGWDGFQEKESILMKNDIHLQFGSGGGLESNTFFMNGTQYFVAALDITQAKQEGLKTFSSNPFAEIHIWGKPTAISLQKSFALLSIPVYYDSTKERSLRKLSDYLPQGPNTQIIKYSTCIETQKGTLQVNVAYWMGGMGINYNPPDPSKQFPTFGIQASLLDSDLFLTSFKQMNDEKKTKIERVYDNKNGRSVPYSTTSKLSVTSPEFLKGFRMIQGFEAAVETSKLADTSNYKCIAINRTRDIKNGKLMVDPRTGKSLTEENDEADEAKREALASGPEKATNSALITLYVILGLILGAFGIALIVYGLQFLIGRRSDVAGMAAAPIVAATATKVAATAAAAAAPATALAAAAPAAVAAAAAPAAVAAAAPAAVAAAAPVTALAAAPAAAAAAAPVTALAAAPAAAAAAAPVTALAAAAPVAAAVTATAAATTKPRNLFFINLLFGTMMILLLVSMGCLYFGFRLIDKNASRIVLITSAVTGGIAVLTLIIVTIIAFTKK